MSLERRVVRDDYFLIRAAMERQLARMLTWPDCKAWYKYIEVDTTLETIYDADNAWIIDESYLTMFDICTPWYSKSILVVEEMIVLRLKPGGDFANVPAFLERKGREAGAKLVCVGTALARTDAALASVYKEYGYRTETHILLKEING